MEADSTTQTTALALPLNLLRSANTAINAGAGYDSGTRLGPVCSSMNVNIVAQQKLCLKITRGFIMINGSQKIY